MKGREWTVAEDARLIQLYGEGLSYGAIATAMGRGSKNEIGGRLNRLAKKGLVQRQGRVFFRPRQSPAPVRKPRGKRRAPPAAVLGKEQCRWPLWNDRERPTHQYCGAPAIEGRPYCPEHHARAYTTSALHGGGTTIPTFPSGAGEGEGRAA